MDVLLPLSLLLALPATWLMDVTVSRPHQAAFLSGAIGRTPDGAIHAEVIDEFTLQKLWTQGAQIGNFELALIDEHRGWPMTTSVRRPATALHMNMFDRPTEQKFVDVRTIDPSMRSAIEKAVAAAPDERVRARWGIAAAAIERHAWGWIAGALLWWILLFIGGAVLIQSLRAATAWFAARSARRALALARKGLCPNCGYNLTGLEWSERCPECGELAE